MIKLTSGDILAADVEALVNSVNCVGIMGRGIALQFKNAFPKNFKAYQAACARGLVQPGRIPWSQKRRVAICAKEKKSWWTNRKACQRE